MLAKKLMVTKQLTLTLRLRWPVSTEKSDGNDIDAVHAYGVPL